MQSYLKKLPISTIKNVRKRPLIFGTLLLTIGGVLTRIIGFFFRIFLSRAFGSEAIGIYQLIAPVLVLAYSFSASGFQTAISKLTAEACGNKQSLESYLYLAFGVLFSITLSFGAGYYVYHNASFLATAFLKEERTAPLLQILAFSFPVSAIHSCVNGFFYGQKNASFPAISQLLEQCTRVISVMLLYHYFENITIQAAVLGIVSGECVAAAFSLFYLFHFIGNNPPVITRKLPIFIFPYRIMVLCVPLSLSRIIQNILQSIEAVAIPNKLQANGLSVSLALSHYGILTGMVLPLILFPTALTNSLAMMLLPTISEANSLSHAARITHTLKRSIHACLLLGFSALLFFLFSADFIGVFLFKEPLTGGYLRTLCFICPFLYVNSALTSILHGLGKTSLSFCLQTIALLLRLGFVFWGIPLLGLTAYLWGLLLSQLLLTFLQLLSLRNYM